MLQLAVYRRMCLVCAFALLQLPAAQGATHYIRANASGNSSGIDWTNAYPSIPQTLVRGDTYYVADGFYGVYSFNQSGTLLTTVNKATVADHGTEAGWDKSYGDGQAIFQRINFLEGSGWLLDGKERTSITGGHGFRIDGNVSGTEQFGLFFRRETAMDNITVRYLEIEGRGYNDTTEYKGFYCVGSGAKTNITLAYSYLHDFGVGTPVHISITGMTLEQSVIARNHSTPAAHSELLSSTNSGTVLIRNNIFTDASGTGFIVELNSGTIGTADNWKIHGNVFHHPGGSIRSIGGDGPIACVNGQICSNWLIYHNSFVTIRSGNNTSRVCLNDRQSLTIGMGNEVKNNIWYESGNATHCAKGMTADYNYYVNTTHTAETHEQITPTSDPFVTRDGLNFRLARATAQGVPLKAEFATDPSGVSRSSDGVWNRGAFNTQFPPTGLTATAR